MRVGGNPDQPTFCAPDICKALGIQNASDALTAVPEDEKGLEMFPTAGGPQSMTVLREPGLYRLIFRSYGGELVTAEGGFTEQVRGLQGMVAQLVGMGVKPVAALRAASRALMVLAGGITVRKSVEVRETLWQQDVETLMGMLEERGYGPGSEVMLKDVMEMAAERGIFQALVAKGHGGMTAMGRWLPIITAKGINGRCLKRMEGCRKSTLRVCAA